MQKRKFFFIIFAVAILFSCVTLFVLWMLDLDATYGTFGFQLDLNDLAAQVNGLTWTLTLMLVLFYLLSALYMFIEARSTEIEIQRKFHTGLGVLFFFIGVAQGIILFYSIFDKAPFDFASDIMPPFEPALNRSDTLWALTLAACSSPLIIHAIEKYIKNSTKFPLTILITIFALCGVVGIISTYILDANPTLENESWWDVYSYAFMALPGAGIVLTMLSLPVIYFSLAKQTSGELKKNSLAIGFGYIFTFIMVIMHMLRDTIVPDLPLNWMIFIIGNIVFALVLMGGYLKSTY